MSKNIVLIGMPGCGKTTIGYEISKKLSMDFVDIDKHIEDNENMTIADMFNIGEDYFRQIESSYVDKISNLHSTVIATGGGVVKNEHNMLALKNNSIIIYINRDVDDIINDIDTSFRPLLKNNKERLFELYNERHPLYQKYSDIEVLNNRDINYIVEKIYNILVREGRIWKYTL